MKRFLGSTTNGLLVGLVILTALVAGGMAVVWLDPSGRQGNRLPEQYGYDLKAAQRVDPKLVGFQETAQYAVALAELHALAVGPDDRLYVAGDSAVLVLSSDGQTLGEIALPAPATCLAVARADNGAERLSRNPFRSTAALGRVGNSAQPRAAVPRFGTDSESLGESTASDDVQLVVGQGDHVEVFTSAGKLLARWPSPGKRSVLTAIDVHETDVWVADAGQRIVHRYRADGSHVGTLGGPVTQSGEAGFIVPSPYFDLAMSPDGLLRVTNPGRRRVEAYTAEGDLELHWGKPGLGIDAFCGCCNPAHLAILPGGEIVTSEKGLARVKLHSADGRLETVVATPEQLAPNPEMAEETRADHRLPVFDVAADSRGRVLVLDPLRRSVRVFEKKASPQK